MKVLYDEKDAVVEIDERDKYIKERNRIIKRNNKIRFIVFFISAQIIVVSCCLFLMCGGKLKDIHALLPFGVLLLAIISLALNFVVIMDWEGELEPNYKAACSCQASYYLFLKDKSLLNQKIVCNKECDRLFVDAEDANSIVSTEVFYIKRKTMPGISEEIIDLEQGIVYVPYSNGSANIDPRLG